MFHKQQCLSPLYFFEEETLFVASNSGAFKILSINFAKIFKQSLILLAKSSILWADYMKEIGSLLDRTKNQTVASLE